MAAKVTPNTIDSHRFVADDTMSYALVPSRGPLVGGLSSRSVKDCRLSAGDKLTIRSTGEAGVTGGYVQTSDGLYESSKNANARHALRRMKRHTQRPAR